MMKCAITLSRCSASLLLAGLSLCCVRERSPGLGFTTGQYPIEIERADLRVRAEDRKLSGTNAECAPCHKKVYDNWRNSRHRVAFTNELYHESHAREPSAWCVNCHAPLAEPGSHPLDLKKRIQAEDGVSCNVCHVRAGKVIAAKKPKPARQTAAHDYTIEPQMAGAAFCESCHEFNFPSADAKPEAGKNFRYSALPMQATHSEWKSSGFQNSPCQNCHLYADSPQSHRFPGGHDRQMLRQSLKVEAERYEDGKLRIRIFSLGVGHAFPTGDLFRTLRLFLHDEKSHSHELHLGKRFDNQPVPPDAMHLPNKALREDTTIPAPVSGEFLSVREFLIDWPASSRQVRYALRLDYLHPHNALVSRLPATITGTDISQGVVSISRGKKSHIKG